MATVTAHRELRKEMQKLPAPVRARTESLLVRIAENPVDPALVHKMQKGWGKRRILVADLPGQYRLAWEIVGDGDVTAWMVGSHEGFYDRLAKRAGR